MSDLRDTRETIDAEHDYAIFDACIDEFLHGRQEYKDAVARYLGLVSRTEASPEQVA